ncbi:MAG: MFS transporter [Clostridium sp.]|uniref:MFS transporter n=1 Tax=Clostridium sp. DSM 8431 TaxID=1761781 RepID=UPI0008EA97DE|nr:MFS transporter [Clostridium sp. DSM 8431]MCR4944652.1 MFS transporter [Clostridium sp.]SFU51735.1 oligogalacturonide transporter [Clostridium sp. DSM 8431]
MKRKITFMNMIGYACINFLGSGSQAIVSAFLMFFYTQCCDIDPIKAGSIFTITRLMDAVLNPLVGSMSDNFGKTAMGRRFGRRRSFTLIGIPLVLIIFPILWTTGHSFSFYFVMNLLWEMTFTLVLVTGTTLPAEMATTAADKTKLVSAKQYFGQFSSGIATAFPAFFAARMGDDNPQAYFYAGVTYAVIMALSLVVFYFFTFERDPKDVHVIETKGLGETLKKMLTDIPSAMQIKSFRLHAAMMLLIGIYKNLCSGVFTYFVVYCLALSKVEAGYITGASQIIAIVAVTITIGLCYKFGGPKAFNYGAVVVCVTCLGYVGLTTMKGSSILVPSLVVIAVLNFMGRAALDYIPVFQLPFMADIDEAVTMQRREGIFTGTNGLLSKVAGAVESFLLGVILQYSGFVKGEAVQPQSAVNTITIMTVAVPMVLLALCFLAARRLKLTKESHKLLVDEVNRIKAGGDKSQVTAEAKEAIEQLTGYAYDKCFGNNNVGYHEKAVNA